MGLVGAIIVRPAGFDQETNRTAYGTPDSAYDHEYLFLLSEMDPFIHDLVDFGLHRPGGQHRGLPRLLVHQRPQRRRHPVGPLRALASQPALRRAGQDPPRREGAAAAHRRRPGSARLAPPRQPLAGSSRGTGVCFPATAAFRPTWRWINSPSRRRRVERWMPSSTGPAKGWAGTSTAPGRDSSTNALGKT